MTYLVVPPSSSSSMRFIVASSTLPGFNPGNDSCAVTVVPAAASVRWTTTVGSVDPTAAGRACTANNAAAPASSTASKLSRPADTTASTLRRPRHAILANWIGADGIWHVDVTDRRPDLREYRDAADYTTAHSTIAATTPHGRLQALADYLGLDWHWLTGRCAQLADYGVAGIAQPRSRHLSVTGVDRACHYLAQAANPTN